MTGMTEKQAIQAQRVIDREIRLGGENETPAETDRKLQRLQIEIGAGKVRQARRDAGNYTWWERVNLTVGKFLGY